MPLNCDIFSRTFYLQNPFCDNLKKKFLKNMPFLIAETGFMVFSARPIDPRKNENLDEMKDSLSSS